MKKKNTWILFVIAFILFNAIFKNEPFSWTTIIRMGWVIPVIGISIFFSVFSKLANNNGKSINPETKEEPIEPKPEKKEPSINQSLYDEDSFKIDPDDYKM